MLASNSGYDIPHLTTADKVNWIKYRHASSVEREMRCPGYHLILNRGLNHTLIVHWNGFDLTSNVGERDHAFSEHHRTELLIHGLVHCFGPILGLDGRQVLVFFA